MRKGLLLSAVGMLSVAGVASAAGGSVSIKLTPNKVSKPSAVSITVTGPYSPSQGLPKSVVIQVQRGFKSSPKSVPVLCTAAQASRNACPAKSKIGSGNASTTATFLGNTYHPTVALTLFLGKPVRRGDISSVVIVGTVQNSPVTGTSHATGRLFKQSGGGLELLFDQLPNFQPPPGATVTLDSLSLRAHALRTVKKGRRRHRHKVRYSLITNPPTCKGRWTGTFTVTFQNGTMVRPLSAACRR